ncbi:MAG: hypothetical protein R8K20_01495 [Gallionellaceae bacterium]
MKQKNWLDRMMNSIAQLFQDWGAVMATREFWAILAVTAIMIGFLIVAGSMLVNFNSMRMRNCFGASNWAAFLMFNILAVFVFAGIAALGEAFNYFDSRKRGIAYKLSSTFSLLIGMVALGSIGLLVLKSAC